MEDIIKTERLTKIYDLASSHPLIAIDNLNLSIHQGEFVVFMGRSGSGKTTLLHLLSTIDELTKGKIIWAKCFSNDRNRKSALS